MKVIWKGSIAFGLVNIPIQVYSATESAALGFTLLHETCLTPLKYHRWCTSCEKEVTWDNTVKGIEKANGKYLVLTADAIKELRPEKTNTLSIVEFVPLETINVIYLHKHYYIAPTKQAENAYALFIQALKKENKVAIGRFVMRDKEYVALIQSYENYLLLTTLHYAYEVRGLEKTAFKKAIKTNPKELSLAREFIEKLSVPAFDISLFKDTFAQEIKKLMKAKPKTKKTYAKAAKTVKVHKKETLVGNLQASLEQVSRRPVAYAKSRR